MKFTYILLNLKILRAIRRHQQQRELNNNMQFLFHCSYLSISLLLASFCHRISRLTFLLQPIICWHSDRNFSQQHEKLTSRGNRWCKMTARNIERLTNSQHKFELYNYYSPVYLLFIQVILHLLLTTQAWRTTKLHD